ncbi:hypothetical protein P43SY_002026 [Pythium insidiosum]|uniref:Uncharacterized protein n=1 Tax=Pythium insidiosum TaxID=114742 RepID=A0AAD5Q8E9_PYTIN|nr:hypothetical protein P43SY_002026 [Pythium insidiosum]
MEDLVKKKVELLALQKAKSDRIYELLNGPGGFNEHSRKTLKNLEAAITASKRPGYFSYYEPPEHVKVIIRSGEVERLHEQVLQLQKQIDQLTEKIDGSVTASGQPLGGSSTGTALSPSRSTSQLTTLPSATSAPNVHSLKQWFAAYGSPKQTSSDLYTSFTPDKKVYGGTTHYSAFRSVASTMKKGRMTR